MEFRTLSDISLHRLTAAFNEGFNEYFFPVNVTVPQMHEKIETEGIDLSKSVGAFEGDRILGFILHGYDVVDGAPTVWNGGTAVMKDARGQSLTRRMYAWALPRLEADGIYTHYLEAIAENAPAIHVYEQVGFHIIRKVDCFQGPRPEVGSAEGVYFTAMEDRDLEVFHSWESCRPTWQHSVASVRRGDLRLRKVAMWEDDQLIGGMAYHAKKGRILLLAIHPDHRGRGRGKLLFSQAGITDSEKVFAMNVDCSAERETGFLKSMGMETMVSQFELKMEVQR